MKILLQVYLTCMILFYLNDFVCDNRYELGFIVSDSDQGQSNVEANVTVLVKRLTPDEVRHTTPLTLASHSQGLVRPHSEVGHTHGKWIIQEILYVLLILTH